MSAIMHGLTTCEFGGGRLRCGKSVWGSVDHVGAGERWHVLLLGAHQASNCAGRGRSMFQVASSPSSTPRRFTLRRLALPLLTSRTHQAAAMARLNTRTSATPQVSRATTVDSLYRNPTPALQANGGSSVRQSSYSVMSPAQSQNSDKENDLPASRDVTPRPKSSGIAIASKRGQRLMTPESGNANKRRRTGDFTHGEPDGHDEGDNMPIFQDDAVGQGLATPEDEAEAEDDDDDEDEEGLRYYNPNQDPEKRRMVSAGIRQHHREIQGERPHAS
jgi:hypothetical protein